MEARMATEEDFDQIADLMPLYHEELGWASLNPDKVADFIDEHIAERRLIVVEDAEEGRVAGVLGVAFGPPWYSDDMAMIETMFFVHPDYRNKKVAGMLLGAASQVAVSVNMPFFCHIYSPGRVRGRGRVANIVGFRPEGYVLRLE